MREALVGSPVRGLNALAEATRTRALSTAARRVANSRAVDLLCTIGEVNRAQAILDATDLGWLHAVAQARVHLAAGELEAASTLATRLAWDPASTLAERTALAVVHAAATAAEDPVAARGPWLQALALAASEGALLPYALLPARLRDGALAEPGLVPPGAAERLGRLGLKPVDEAPLVRLTVRERVVLAQLARHETLGEVAEALTVSVNTIRKQTLSVYAKLGVHERTDALRRARELGLL
jgi:LuxR family maltose regulon positive regulatory protein